MLSHWGRVIGFGCLGRFRHDGSSYGKILSGCLMVGSRTRGDVGWYGSGLKVVDGDGGEVEAGAPGTKNALITN